MKLAATSSLGGVQCLHSERHGYSAGSPCSPPASTQPSTALGPVPLTALAPIEGSASNVEEDSDESYQG
eukprot:6474240-Prymnesium_polylepis.1